MYKALARSYTVEILRYESRKLSVSGGSGTRAYVSRIVPDTRQRFVNIKPYKLDEKSLQDLF